MPNFTISGDGKSITCNRCEFKSYNPNDVLYRYCGNCRYFLDVPYLFSNDGKLMKQLSVLRVSLTDTNIGDHTA